MESYSIKKQDEITWKTIGIIILSLRFVQGWIFWGGGSRRFIYDPMKLDPYSSQWMANKLQSAMPGALLGINHIISFLLQHFFLLYSSIIFFSLLELLSGIALIVGFFTRSAAFITVLISITLMLIFGWQGTTCMDEWTMAVSNFAIGLTLVLSGGSIYSVDNWMQRRFHRFAQNKWFVVLASGSFSYAKLKKAGILFLIFTILFTLTTYNYYRGAIFSKYHSGPVSAYEYNIKLSNGIVHQNGSVTFNLYVNAGPAAVPTYITRIELSDSHGKLIEEWRRLQLKNLVANQVHNKYAYNKISIGSYGIIAPVSAEAEITLPSVVNGLKLLDRIYKLNLFTIQGERFDLILQNLTNS